jgi:Glycosyltransferase family 87
VNGLLFAGFVGTWLLARSGQDRAAGALVAVMSAVKVWPVQLVVWFVAQGRRSALASFIGAAVVIALASVLFAGLDANLAYIGIGATIKPSPGSIAGMLLTVGINIPWVGYAIAAAAAIALFAFRRFVGMTYAIAISAIVVATPALYLNSFALLVTAMSPFAWPVLMHPLPPGTIGGLRERTNARIVEQ